MKRSSSGSTTGSIWRRAVLLAAFAGTIASVAQAADKKVDKSAAAERPPVEAAAAPELPAYFTATSPAKKPTWPDATGAASGIWATPAGDGKGDVPATVANDGLYDRVAHNLYSINFVWTLITGFLVMFMQAGFMSVETGLCRTKNASHTTGMNFLIYPLGCFGFWAYGFAIGWGNWWNGAVPPGWYPSLGPGLSTLTSGLGIGPAMNAAGDPTGAFQYGLMGTKGFFLNGMDDVGVLALFFFMMVFMDTTATIPTGAMAERWSFKNFTLYGLWVALPYCLYANWVWGGGFLAQGGLNWGLGHGAVDFAGSGVVHAMGGLIGLVGASILGPRIGKYDSKGRPRAMPGHSVPMVALGTFILAFGWFGFNPGSTLAGTDLRISFVVVNTMLASMASTIMAYITLLTRDLKPDTTMLCNGMLAGLVAITAPCAFVSPWAAVAIGGVAGWLVVASVFFIENRGVDDPCGAISVHGTSGLWGVLAVGIFANGDYGAGWNGVVRESMVTAYGYDGVRGVLYGDPSQLWMQMLDCAVLVCFAIPMAYMWFRLSNVLTPLRSAAEDELAGLDATEMGSPGYPEFLLTPDRTIPEPASLVLGGGSPVTKPEVALA